MLIMDMMKIKILYKQGKSIRTIAKETGFSKNTVSSLFELPTSPLASVLQGPFHIEQSSQAQVFAAFLTKLFTL